MRIHLCTECGAQTPTNDDAPLPAFCSGCGKARTAVTATVAGSNCVACGRHHNSRTSVTMPAILHDSDGRRLGGDSDLFNWPVCSLRCLIAFASIFTRQGVP